jgi:biopolymer transport protein ExbD
MARGIVRKAAEHSEQQIDLTPMLDVVFIMLIFFIVNASFIKEPGVDVERPEAETLERIENQNILVAITGKNEVWINKEIVKPTSVKAKIQAMHIENPKGAVVIQADQESTAEMFALVYDAAREAGVQPNDIQLATVED